MLYKLISFKPSSTWMYSSISIFYLSTERSALLNLIGSNDAFSCNIYLLYTIFWRISSSSCGSLYRSPQLRWDPYTPIHIIHVTHNEKGSLLHTGCSRGTCAFHINIQCAGILFYTMAYAMRIVWSKSLVQTNQKVIVMQSCVTSCFLQDIWGLLKTAPAAA